MRGEALSEDFKKFTKLMLDTDVKNASYYVGDIPCDGLLVKPGYDIRSVGGHLDIDALTVECTAPAVCVIHVHFCGHENFTLFLCEAHICRAQNAFTEVPSPELSMN